MTYKGKLWGMVGRQRIPLRMTSEDVDRMESDLSDALAMLRSVQGYLEAGMCGCLYDGAYLSTCRRCDLLDDVKTTLANCGSESAKFNKILNFEENAEKAK